MAKRIHKVHGIKTELVKDGNRVKLQVHSEVDKPLFEAQVERLIEVLGEQLQHMRTQNEPPEGYQRVRKPL